MEQILVYPPLDAFRGKQKGDEPRALAFDRLEDIPMQLTRDAGYQAFRLKLTHPAAVAGGEAPHATFDAQELLEEFDRIRFKQTNESGAVRLLSPVAGIPPTIAHIRRTEGANPIFVITQRMDCNSVVVNDVTYTFDRISLEPGEYTLDNEMRPVEWKGAKTA